MPRTKNAKRKSLSPSQDVDSDDESEELTAGLGFSQLPPELSQPIFPVKPTEQRNLDSLPSEAREKHLMDLSRIVLFKALAGEPIDRLKVCKEAGIKTDQAKISTAAFAEVAERLRNVFGFELKRIPKFMEKSKSISKKYKDRFFVVNGNIDDSSPGHSKAIHSVHADSAVQKGFLMLVLALIFCKGEPRSDGSRWILDSDLYHILSTVDENIPAEPPAQGSRKQGNTRRSSQEDGGAMTPDVDGLLDKYVHLDYIVKEKLTDERAHLYPDAEENSHLFALGPRAAIEIGRKQVVYFCSEILDQDPDPTMLLELEDDEQEEEEEDMEEAGE